MRAHAAALGLFLTILACSAPREGQRDVAGESRSVAIAPTNIDTLLMLGDSVLRQSPDSASRLWTTALAAAQAASDSARIARALTGLGQSARLLGDAAQARQLGERALALKLRLGMQGELFRSYNALGLLAWTEERLDDASRLFAQAIDAARASGDSAGLIKAALNEGLVAMDLGGFASARTAFERARDGARARNDSVTLARALNNLAGLDVAMCDPVAAIAGLEPARRIARAVGDSVTEVNARGQLATAYDALGEPQRAFDLLDSALTMARRDKRRGEEADDLKLIADLFLDAGDARHALDYYGQALVITESLGLMEERGNILRNTAVALQSLGNVSLALARATEARRVHRSSALRHPELSDLIVLSSLAARLGRTADAESHLAAARRLAASLDAPVATVRVTIAEASIAAQTGQWARVLRSLEQPRSSLALLGSGAESEALLLRARAHARLGQTDAALAEGRRAIAAVERVRRSYGSGELRTAYASEKFEIYGFQVLLLLRAGRTDEAFEVADAARGRALLEHLASARADLRAARAADPMLAGEALLRRIDALVARLQRREMTPSRERSPSSDAVEGGLRDSILAARAEYEALTARRAEWPTPATVRVERASAAAVRRALQPNELLLEYLVTPERLVIFAARAKGLSTFEVNEPEAALVARVQLARELIKRRATRHAADGTLRALHRILLSPIARAGGLRGVTRLIVVPHGVLTYLPFAALLDSATQRYVAEDIAVMHLPTSASLLPLRGERPAMRSAYADAEVFAPFPDSLPATREEAIGVGRALGGGVVRLGSDATERQVRAALQRGSAVHVATHARMNARNPLFSHIVLAAGEHGTGRTRNDGVLEVHELLALRFDSPLVFLSGCETALGGAWTTRFDTGEDYVTIAQTLLYAGARNVVATLWRIDDAGAAEFAKHFYTALPTSPVPEALNLAQRAMIADPRYGSPYFWAAYEASGVGMQLPTANVADRSDRR